MIFPKFVNTLPVAFMISSRTITEISAILLNIYHSYKYTCQDSKLNLFCTHGIFYTCIDMNHYFIFDLNYMLYYWICICSQMNYVLPWLSFIYSCCHVKRFNIFFFCFTEISTESHAWFIIYWYMFSWQRFTITQ